MESSLSLDTVMDEILMLVGLLNGGPVFVKLEGASIDGILQLKEVTSHLL